MRVPRLPGERRWEGRGDGVRRGLRKDPSPGYPVRRNFAKARRPVWSMVPMERSWGSELLVTSSRSSSSGMSATASLCGFSRALSLALEPGRSPGVNERLSSLFVTCFKADFMISDVPLPSSVLFCENVMGVMPSLRRSSKPLAVRSCVSLSDGSSGFRPRSPFCGSSVPFLPFNEAAGEPSGLVLVFFLSSSVRFVFCDMGSLPFTLLLRPSRRPSLAFSNNESSRCSSSSKCHISSESLVMGI